MSSQSPALVAVANYTQFLRELAEALRSAQIDQALNEICPGAVPAISKTYVDELKRHEQTLSFAMSIAKIDTSEVCQKEFDDWVKKLRQLASNDFAAMTQMCQ
jgi:hypothetical protein